LTAKDARNAKGSCVVGALIKVHRLGLAFVNDTGSVVVLKLGVLGVLGG